MTKYIRTYLVDITRFRLQILRKYPLSSFGLNGLDFNWNHPFLYRVFNQGSFKLGGRFFGSFHLELPKTLRPYILINDESTIEADYMALHIRMLYHLEGIHYDTDPYEDVAQGRDERAIYKLVLLIAINAETEKDAIQAIRKRLHSAGIYEGLKDQDIKSRLERFKSVHPRIAHYLNTGIGRRLQNLDSRITDIILKELTRKGIPCLPVHDSYIVPRQHIDYLLQVMDSAYQDIMKGFRPEVDVKVAA